MTRQIGYISTCISNDDRYSATISVVVTADLSLQVKLSTSSPEGGMDTFTKAVHTDFSIVKDFGKINSNSSKDLLKYLRKAFKTLDFGIFAKYSKPTKEFRWTVENEDGYAENIYGFNADLADSAISFAIEMLT